MFDIKSKHQILKKRQKSRLPFAAVEGKKSECSVFLLFKNTYHSIGFINIGMMPDLKSNSG